MTIPIFGTTARRIICLAVLLLGTRSSAWAVDDVDRLLIINGNSESLTLIDRAGDSVVQNVLTLGLVPNRIRAATGALLIVHSVSDNIWVVDPSTFAVTRTIAFPDGDNLWDAVAVDDTLAAATMLVANNVALMNYATGDTLGRIPVGKSPEGLAVVNGNLWVANTGFDFNTFLYDSGTVSVVEPSTGTVAATIPVGTNPQALAKAPDGTVHVLCTGNFADQFGIVYVISPGDFTVLDSIPLGGAPGDLVMAHDGIAYVAAGGFSDSGQVYRYNALTRTVLNGSGNPWKTAQGVLGVIPRGEGGVFAIAFGADSVIGHTLDGAVTEAFQVGDGPVAGIHITNRCPGDIDESGAPDPVDISRMVDLVFFGAPAPPRPASADLNGDCVYDATDLSALIDVVFFGSLFAYWGCAL